MIRKPAADTGANKVNSMLEANRLDAASRTQPSTLPQIRPREYELHETVRAYEGSDDPHAREMIEILLNPPTPDEVIEHAESLKVRE
jgi:hypothetical protein